MDISPPEKFVDNCAASCSNALHKNLPSSSLVSPKPNQLKYTIQPEHLQPLNPKRNPSALLVKHNVVIPLEEIKRNATRMCEDFGYDEGNMPSTSTRVRTPFTSKTGTSTQKATENSYFNNGDQWKAVIGPSQQTLSSHATPLSRYSHSVLSPCPTYEEADIPIIACNVSDDDMHGNSTEIEDDAEEQEIVLGEEEIQEQRDGDAVIEDEEINDEDEDDDNVDENTNQISFLENNICDNEQSSVISDKNECNRFKRSTSKQSTHKSSGKRISSTKSSRHFVENAGSIQEPLRMVSEDAKKRSTAFTNLCPPENPDNFGLMSAQTLNANSMFKHALHPEDTFSLITPDSTAVDRSMGILMASSRSESKHLPHHQNTELHDFAEGFSRTRYLDRNMQNNVNLIGSGGRKERRKDSSMSGLHERLANPRTSLHGKSLTFRISRNEIRYRKLQAKTYNFLERPKTWPAIAYHFVV